MFVSYDNKSGVNVLCHDVLSNDNSNLVIIKDGDIATVLLLLSLS